MTPARPGRDNNEASDWASMRDEAARPDDRRTSGYLLGKPLLTDFLEQGLSMLGHSCEEFEINGSEKFHPASPTPSAGLSIARVTTSSRSICSRKRCG